MYACMHVCMYACVHVCYVMLCCVVLWYIMLGYVMLCYVCMHACIHICIEKLQAAVEQPVALLRLRTVAAIPLLHTLYRCTANLLS